jgi:hypothetical protein
VDYLLPLYDLLVSINVPNEKARAVVDAMERDMGTRIATKADLQYLGTELRQEILMVRKDLQLLEANLKSELTLRLGSMMVVLVGLLFAALKLT